MRYDQAVQQLPWNGTCNKWLTLRSSMNGGSCAGRLVAQTLSHVLGGSTADLLRAAAASGAAAEGPAVASTPTDLPVVGRLAGAVLERVITSSGSSSSAGRRAVQQRGEGC